MKNKNIFQSIRCAAHGIAECYRTERNFMEYTAIALVMLTLNILLKCAVWEYIVFITLVTAAFSAEFLNTAIERVIDTYDNTISEKNRFIKDAAAGGVLIIAAAFFTAEALILIPKALELLK